MGVKGVAVNLIFIGVLVIGLSFLFGFAGLIAAMAIWIILAFRASRKQRSFLFYPKEFAINYEDESVPREDIPNYEVENGVKLRISLKICPECRRLALTEQETCPNCHYSMRKCFVTGEIFQNFLLANHR